ncbi:helix-turn-helix domain-containing protein, partial [bacterium]
MSNLEGLVGVVHKLKPEVIKFIIDNKQTNMHLSCRNLAVLLQEKLQVKLSKSSINDIFKVNSLSMPVGRRQKPKKRKFNMPVLPVIEEKVKEEIIEKQEKDVLHKAEKEEAKLKEEQE